MIVSLIDAGIVGLLLGALIYMFLLNRRLNTINRNRAAIEKLLESFSHSLVKAETSLLKLQESSAKFEKDLQEKIRTGTSLTDDLVFFIDRGEVLAVELEKEVRKARELKQELAIADSQDARKSPKPSFHKKEEVFSAPLSTPQERLVPQQAVGLL